MKFLANENFPIPSVKLLREKDFDVLSLAESNPGIDDEKVIALAVTAKRVILTFDKDYGEIIFRYKIADPPSVVFYRVKGTTPFEAGETLLKILSRENLQIENHFTIIEANGIRQRKY